MTTPVHATLADIVRVAVGDRILGLRTGTALERTLDGQLHVPQFERRVWFQQVQGDRLTPLPSALMDELAEDGSGQAVFVDTFVRVDPRTRRTLAIRKNGGVYKDSGAVIYHVLEGLPSGTTVAFLAPASVTVQKRFEDLRAKIDDVHGVEWLIYVDGRLLPGVHHAFHCVILVVVINAGPAQVTRLVDLRGDDPGHWLRETRAAKKRGGGEVGRSIVLRETRLGHSAWTYECWTKAFNDSKSDSQELGALRPLAELVDSVVTGLHLTRDAAILKPVDDEDECFDGFVPVIGGREVRQEGIMLPGRFWALPDAVPERAMVSEGDLLLRAFVSPGQTGPKIVGAVVPEGLDAVLGHNVLRLRWKPEVTAQARDLLISWILSERASKSLAARGVSGHLHASFLLELEVPDPSQTVVAALENLSELEHWYRTRAESVWNARQAVFSAKRYSEVISMLLHAQQVEGERVTAAENSQRFDYQVRNYFPHPIALRRERLQVHEHGKLRLGETLDCAEHLVHFLALCGLVQLRALRPDERLPSRHLTSTLDGRLRFSWGNSWSVLKEAVDATRKLKDPLVAPIPQLSFLVDIVGQPGSGSWKAEAELRLRRNNQSHLHRVPEPELVEMSERMGEALDELLKAVVFLADIPLVHVRDYALNGFTDERKVVFDLLRGASVVFDRSVQVVDREIPRESVGLLGHRGEFHSLGPWLHLHNCEVCKRPEVFLFNRCEGGKVTFVAMETGHAWVSEKHSSLFSKLLMPLTTR